MKVEPGSQLAVETGIFAARWSYEWTDELEVRGWANRCIDAGVVTDRISELAYTFRDSGGPDSRKVVEDALAEVGVEIPVGDARTLFLALDASTRSQRGEVSSIEASREIQKAISLNNFEPEFLSAVLVLVADFDIAKSDESRSQIEQECKRLIESCLPRLLELTGAAKPSR